MSSNLQITPYLNFDGRCREAFEYYEKVLGGKIETIQSFAETPACEHVPKEIQHHIMHARLLIGSQTLMGSDSTPMCPYEGVKGFAVALNVNSIAEAERVFGALSKNGKVEMPLDQTFWAVRFGACTDQFGIPWMVNCEKES